MMNKNDRVISDLMNALDLIIRVAEHGQQADLYYIQGAAKMARDNCNRERKLNADGYLVVTTAAGGELPGLNIDMLDADRLRAIADGIEAEVRAVGELRQALSVNR